MTDPMRVLAESAGSTDELVVKLVAALREQLTRGSTLNRRLTVAEGRADIAERKVSAMSASLSVLSSNLGEIASDAHRALNGENLQIASWSDFPKHQSPWWNNVGMWKNSHGREIPLRHLSRAHRAAIVARLRASAEDIKDHVRQEAFDNSGSAAAIEKIQGTDAQVFAEATPLMMRLRQLYADEFDGKPGRG